MATSSLYPPNSQSLSDGIISAVVQRAGIVRERISPNSLHGASTNNTHAAGLRPPLESPYPVDVLSDRKRRHSPLPPQQRTSRRESAPRSLSTTLRSTKT